MDTSQRASEVPGLLIAAAGLFILLAIPKDHMSPESDDEFKARVAAQHGAGAAPRHGTPDCTCIPCVAARRSPETEVARAGDPARLQAALHELGLSPGFAVTGLVVEHYRETFYVYPVHGLAEVPWVAYVVADDPDADDGYTNIEGSGMTPMGAIEDANGKLVKRERGER